MYAVHHKAWGAGASGVGVMTGGMVKPFSTLRQTLTHHVYEKMDSSKHQAELTPAGQQLQPYEQLLPWQLPRQLREQLPPA